MKDHNVTFVCDTVRAIGRVVDTLDTTTTTIDDVSELCSSCMQGLMHLLLCYLRKSRLVVAECVTVLRQQLQQTAHYPSSSPTAVVSQRILHQLVKLLLSEDGIENQDDSSRSSIVWLVGEFQHLLLPVAPDILRILAAGFVGELLLLLLFLFLLSFL